MQKNQHNIFCSKKNFMELIDFKKNGYDPQIDYIKGICIIFVILTHSMYRYELRPILFPYWGDTAVPIFIIIQAFHYYKKGLDIRMPNITKLWKNVILPFIITLALMFTAQYFFYFNKTNGIFSPALYWDKRGPGSYYVFIYLELAFIIPLFAPIIKKLSTKWILVFFIILSQLIEIVASITHCPDVIYRNLFIRYTFLLYLGYLMATKKLILNKITLLTGFIGIISLYIFNYTDIDLEPFFYTSLYNWKYCHWVCYLYITYIFIWLLKKSYIHLTPYKSIQKGIVLIGKHSYYIYLFQIIYFATICYYVYSTLSNFIDNHFIVRLTYIIISTIICIISVVCFKRVYQYPHDKERKR